MTRNYTLELAPILRNAASFMPPSPPSAAPPRPPAVRHLIQMVDAALRANDPAAALTAARQAEVLAADDPAVLQRLGRALLASGKPAEAIAPLVRVARAIPLNGTWTELGDALLRAGDTATAVQALTKAISLESAVPHSHVLLLRALLADNRIWQALKVAEAARNRFPEHPVIRQLTGTARKRMAGHLHRQNRPAEAEPLLRAVLADTPDDWSALLDLGVVLRPLGRLDEAIALYRRALTLKETPLLHGNLGNALALTGQDEAAEHHLRRAVALAPDAVESHYNLGSFLTDQDRPAEALIHLDTAIALRPEASDALTNRGVALTALGRTDEAIASYRAALALRPDWAETHYDLAWTLLLDGDLDEGWAEYEWRWKLPGFSSQQRRIPAPEWDGRRLDGTLLLHAEQGLGDTVWMLRFVAWAQRHCQRVVLLCPPSLVRLARTTPGLDDVIADTDQASLPPVAAHLPLMSLPRLAGSRHGIAAPAYLHASPSTLSGEGLHIGLVWAGNPDNKLDRVRSVPFPCLRPILETPGVTFHNLQVGPGRSAMAEAPDLAALLVDHGPHLTDFAQTAAIIAACDLIIAVDTAVAHVAGALGRPGWVMLPLSPGLPWRLTGTISPWYPSLTLCRQDHRGDWTPVVKRIAETLKHRIDTGVSSR